jgi:PEP-CTERM motif
LATGADASADAPGPRSGWSYGFDDSSWTNDGLKRPMTLSPLADWAPRCLAGCGPIFGTSVVQRTELFSSNNADLSVNKTADSNGHALGLTGVIITERLDPYGFAADPDSWTDWRVVGERMLDSGGTHSWSLLSPDISPDAHWLPIELYQFEGSSVSLDFAASAPAGASATPEPSTLAMTLIGVAALAVAGYRSSRNCRRLIGSPRGTYPR